MTTKQARSLKPGDKIRIISLGGWDIEKAYLGEILTVGDPPLSNNRFYINFIEKRYNISKIAIEDVEIVNSKHKCQCPISVIFLRGCICGGI